MCLNVLRGPFWSTLSPLVLPISARSPAGVLPVVGGQTISLGDVLKFSVSPSQTRDSLTTTAPGVPLDGSNLVGAWTPPQLHASQNPFQAECLASVHGCWGLCRGPLPKEGRMRACSMRGLRTSCSSLACRHSI